MPCVVTGEYDVSAWCRGARDVNCGDVSVNCGDVNVNCGDVN